MFYTYYERGKCQTCNDIIWINHAPEHGGVICKCGEASILHGVKINLADITDAEHLVPLEKEFWWLSGETVNPTINIIKG